MCIENSVPFHFSTEFPLQKFGAPKNFFRKKVVFTGHFSEKIVLPPQNDIFCENYALWCFTCYCPIRLRLTSLTSKLYKFFWYIDARTHPATLKELTRSDGRVCRYDDHMVSFVVEFVFFILPFCSWFWNYSTSVNGSLRLRHWHLCFCYCANRQKGRILWKKQNSISQQKKFTQH